jgi:phosphoserine phosphatase RsbU/P
MAKKFQIPIKYKFLSVLVLTLALGFFTFFALAYRTFSEDKKIFVMELNLSVLGTAVSDTRADLKSRVDELQTLLPKLYENNNTVSSKLFKDLSIQYLPDELIGIRFYRRNLASNSFTLIKEISNQTFLETRTLPNTTVQDIEKNSPAPLGQFSFVSGMQLLNRSLRLKTNSGISPLPVLTFLIPGTFVNDNSKSILIVVDIVQDFLEKKLQKSDMAEVFLITKSGQLLSHGSSSFLAENTNRILNHPVVARLKTKQLPKESLELKVNKESYLVNLSDTEIPNTFAVSQIKQSEAFQALKSLVRETLLTGIFIFAIAIILSIVFSNKLTSNIKLLRKAAETIGQQGSLDVELKVKSNDEIRSVADSFNVMSTRIKQLISETIEKEKELLQENVKKQRMAEELETAKLIQATILSSPKLETDTVQVEAFYLSASECGGDLWDAYLCENILTVLVGDATGHGAPAAIVTAVAKSCFATLNSIYSDRPLSPEAFLTQLNRIIYESCRGELLMTMAVIQINLHTGEIVFSNGGHESPLLLRAETSPDVSSKSESLFVRGERLGFSHDSVFSTVKEQLSLGDSLLIYTDGVSEAVNPEGKLFGERAIKKLFNRIGNRSLKEVKDQIYAELKTFMDSQPQGDDITYVLIRWNKKSDNVVVLPESQNQNLAPILHQVLPQEPKPALEIDYSNTSGENGDISELLPNQHQELPQSLELYGIEISNEWIEPSELLEISGIVLNAKQKVLNFSDTEAALYIDEGVQSVISEPAPQVIVSPTSEISTQASAETISQIELLKTQVLTDEDMSTEYARVEQVSEIGSVETSQETDRNYARIEESAQKNDSSDDEAA